MGVVFREATTEPGEIAGGYFVDHLVVSAKRDDADVVCWLRAKRGVRDCGLRVGGWVIIKEPMATYNYPDHEGEGEAATKDDPRNKPRLEVDGVSGDEEAAEPESGADHHCPKEKHYHRSYEGRHMNG